LLKALQNVDQLRLVTDVSTMREINICFPEKNEPRKHNPVLLKDEVLFQVYISLNIES